MVESEVREVRAYTRNEKLIQERRDHILGCVLGVFLRKGYKATTVKDLAEACGMPEGTIYRYIGSKDDLLHLLCLKRARGRERLQQALAAAGDQTATDALKTAIRFYFEMGDSGRDINLFFNREIRYFSSQDRRFLLEAQSAVTEVFRELLEKGVATGEFQMRSPLAVAHSILMLGHDWGLRRWFLSQYFTLQEYTDIHTELILKQITPATTRSKHKTRVGAR